MDRAGLYPPEMVAKIKDFFPETKGVLSSAMVDKRLRQLDQIPEVDFWRSDELAKKARDARANAAVDMATPLRTDSRVAGKENSPAVGSIMRVSISRSC